MQQSNLANVRPKSWVFDLVPWLGKNTATAIYPYVYVPRTIYAALQQENPSPYHVALVLHEQEHIKRIKATGVYRWYVAYFCSRQFRFEEELVATEPQLRYLKKYGLTIDLQRRARFLSGWFTFGR